MPVYQYGIGLIYNQMVFLEHRPRVYFSLITTAVEATALFIQQHVKGAIIVYHVTPPHGKKWLLFRMIVRELRQ